MKPKYEVIDLLVKFQAFDFSGVELKSGGVSPIYITLREVGNMPLVRKAIADSLWQKIEGKDYDFICGVPETANDLATTLSDKYHIPKLRRRKAIDAHGKKRVIEGFVNWNSSDKPRCLIIDDVLTSGKSVMETAQPLAEAGFEVKNAVILIDRQQGGKENLEKQGLQVETLFCMDDIVRHLIATKTLTEEKGKEILDYLKQHSKLGAV